jgi:lipopolysaccharide biosynthesis glycosyltransferase
MTTKNLETIHVAYAFDDNYAEMSVVSMVSLLANTECNIYIHVLENRLSEENKAVLESLTNRHHNLRLSIYHLEPDLSFMITDNYLSPETYFRLCIPETIPNIARIIWIDSDTIMRRDIAELWDTDLKGNIVGMCIDAGNNLTEFHHRKEVLEINDDNFYYNAGVMLIDVGKFKNFDVLGKIEITESRLYKRVQDKKLTWYADQDIINYLLQGKICALAPKFNFQDAFYPIYRSPMVDNIDNHSLTDWVEAFQNPVISHFVGVQKPSKITRYRMGALGWKVYYEYKALSPFADVEKDNSGIANYDRREEKEKEGLLDRVSFIENHFYEIFLQTADFVAKTIGNRKLAIWGAGVHTRCQMVVLASKGIAADLVVDGTTDKQNTKVFDYVVQNPAMLNGKSGEYFVLLTMEQMKPANTVFGILKEYGYVETRDCLHTYKSTWEFMNERL